MMNNYVILPVLIPLLTGIILIIFRKNIVWQRCLSLLSFLLMIVVCTYLVHLVSVGGIQTLRIGGWDAPFGIILVADMFASLLLLTASTTGIFCLWFAFRSIGAERERFYFYPFLQFLMVGVNGSFLTGDLFNLFVCFEVMLMASYVLVSLGGTKIQLRASITYVLINILSSMLFLVAVAYLYAIVGTLNMAHLSVRVAEAGQRNRLRLSV
jgi:multicomponent Na+:H+ antiporter subunit D